MTRPEANETNTIPARRPPQVLKIGGNQLDDPAFVRALVDLVKQMCSTGAPPIVVHGGGKSISLLQERFGVPTRKIGGLRVTDELTMQLVMMALIGQANALLVAAFTAQDIEAQGFHGADRGLLRSRPLHHSDGDLGRVGQVTRVRSDVIHALLAAGVVPVIAPVALAEDGGFHNINADQAAGAIAAALGAAEVAFVTDVPGVLHDGQVLGELSREAAEGLIAGGVARDGMAVKIRAALDALSGGVGRARIANVDGLRGANRDLPGGTLIG